MSKFVDLHLHTTFSDGGDDPEVVVARAVENGFSAIAITDHDTLTGIPRAQAAADKAGLELMPGVEISAQWGKMEIHILGLGVDPYSESLTTVLQTLSNERALRAEKIVDKLNKLDVPVSIEDLKEKYGDGVIGRMHIAQEIVALGKAPTVQGGFDLYIKAGKKAYVPKKAISSDKAIESIHAAEGLAFIAHPCIGKVRNSLTKMLQKPFDGIEVFHSKHTPGHIAELQAVATERKLLISGGSDCHGSIKGHAPLMGQIRFPYSEYEKIKAALS